MKPGGIPTQYVDSDPEESREWIESLDATIDAAWPGAPAWCANCCDRASERNLGIADLRQTDYINTIHPEDEPEFPGDEEIEHRLRRTSRWNAAIMVHRAQRPRYRPSAGTSVPTRRPRRSNEVGFNHFFNGPDAGGRSDLLPGPRAGHLRPRLPGGRISEDRMDGFRQELSHGGFWARPAQLSAPAAHGDFWQFPTVSMGLGPEAAIYQARFNRYLHNRGIKDTSRQHGPSSVTVRPTSRRPWAIWASPPARAWTT